MSWNDSECEKKLYHIQSQMLMRILGNDAHLNEKR